MTDSRRQARKCLPPNWHRRKPALQHRIRTQFFGQLTLWPTWRFTRADTHPQS